MRHLLSLKDLSLLEIMRLVKKGIDIKKRPKTYGRKLIGKQLLMIFAKPSLRTRLSFEVGITQLGGDAIFYSIADSPLGKKETIADTARVVSRYVDIVMDRFYEHSEMLEFAAASSVPVINGLTNFNHPCQILGDLMTILEKKKKLKGLKLVYLGDGNNNVTHSLMYGCSKVGIKMIVVCPKAKKYMPLSSVVKDTKVSVKHSISDVKGADVVYTDSWMSYHIPKVQEMFRVRALKKYQVNSEVMKMAGRKAIFMHCLPAGRGVEVTDSVMDSRQSVILDQAENRMHVQKAVMLWLLGK